MEPRCFLPSEVWGDASTLTLTGREAHHLKDVLRVKSGDTIHCFDGAGQQAQGQVTAISRKEITLTLQSRSILPAAADAIHLGVAVPGQGKIEPIVGQATQLGVAAIFPLITERTVARIPADRAAQKLERLQQVSIEAGKQSGVAYLPFIHPFAPWTSILSSFAEYDLVLMATVEGPHELLTQLLPKKKVSRVLILIGPEGDWTESEIKEAVELGAHRIGLGKSVLRCDTAVVAAVGTVATLLQEFHGFTHVSAP